MASLGDLGAEKAYNLRQRRLGFLRAGEIHGPFLLGLDRIVSGIGVGEPRPRLTSLCQSAASPLREVYQCGLATCPAASSEVQAERFAFDCVPSELGANKLAGTLSHESDSFPGPRSETYRHHLSFKRRDTCLRVYLWHLVINILREYTCAKLDWHPQKLVDFLDHSRRSPSIAS